MPALAQTSSGLTSFDEITIERLDGLSEKEIDALPFGVIGIAPTGEAEIYSLPESRLTGLAPERVLGRRFFAEIGRCMNNDLVAGRFLNEPDLDATLDYVLTLKMQVTPARLRLLRGASVRRRYLLVQR